MTTLLDRIDRDCHPVDIVEQLATLHDWAFDRSAEAAVRKADPLPMPDSPSLQAQFRDFKFEFDPAKGQ